MILQALCDYYRRQEEEMPPPGFGREEIAFLIVLDRSGCLFDIDDYRDDSKKGSRAKFFTVPQRVKKSVNIAANLLWGTPDYVLGIAKGNDAEDDQKKAKRAHQAHTAFVQRIHDFFPNQVEDEGIKSVLAFLAKGDFNCILNHRLGADLIKSIKPLSFRLEGDTELICQRQIMYHTLTDRGKSEQGIHGNCLVTGKKDVIARLHPSVKGVYGVPRGADIFSFNFPAACSHGKVPKDRGMNAPVGEYAAFAYTTALNHLLRPNSRQKLLVGEDTFVFWAEKPDPAEGLIADWLQPDPDDPARGTIAVEALCKAPQTGVRPFEDDYTRFFVLGLAPNNARLAVRLWHVNTVRELAANIRQHFDDLAIVRSPRDPEYLPLWRLLKATAAQGKSENIPPLLDGEVLRAILTGTPFPQILLAITLQRIRAEQSKRDKNGRSVLNVTYERAALLKAVLTRNNRFHNFHEQEINVSLDIENSNIGYRLGRLFATLEHIQKLASPNLNATIRDRFYGAASATPVTVFPYLLKLKNHHLGKLATGQVIWLENLIAQIIDEINEFPPSLNLDNQGRFAIGYYHQRQDFFKKK